MKATDLIVATFLFALLAGCGMWASQELGAWLYPHGVFGRYISSMMAGAIVTIVALPVGLLFTAVMAFFIRLEREPRGLMVVRYLLIALLLAAPIVWALYEIDMRDARPLLQAFNRSEHMHADLARDTYGDVLLRALLTPLPAALITTAWLIRAAALSGPSGRGFKASDEKAI